MHFLEWKLLYFESDFTEVCSLRSNWQLISIGTGNGLASNRWQAIIWTNDGLVYWRISASVLLDDLRSETANYIFNNSAPFVPVNRSQANKSDKLPPGFYEVFSWFTTDSPRFPGDKSAHDIPHMYSHIPAHYGGHHPSNGVNKFRGLVPEKNRDSRLWNVEQAL